MCNSIGKADQLSYHYDTKRSSESVDLPLTCLPSPYLITSAFWLSEVRRRQLDTDSYCGTDSLCMLPFPLLKRSNEVLVPCLGVVFCLLLRLGSFPACTTIPEGSLSSSVANY